MFLIGEDFGRTQTQRAEGGDLSTVVAPAITGTLCSNSGTRTQASQCSAKDSVQDTRLVLVHSRYLGLTALYGYFIMDIHVTSFLPPLFPVCLNRLSKASRTDSDHLWVISGHPGSQHALGLPLLTTQTPSPVPPGLLPLASGAVRQVPPGLCQEQGHSHLPNRVYMPEPRHFLPAPVLSAISANHLEHYLFTILN